MVRDVTCTEIRGRMTIHHYDDCVDQSTFYESFDKIIWTTDECLFMGHVCGCQVL